MLVLWVQDTFDRFSQINCMTMTSDAFDTCFEVPTTQKGGPFCVLGTSA